MEIIEANVQDIYLVPNKVKKFARLQKCCSHCNSKFKISFKDIFVDVDKSWLYGYYRGYGWRCPICKTRNLISKKEYARLDEYNTAAMMHMDSLVAHTSPKHIYYTPEFEPFREESEAKIRERIKNCGPSPEVLYKCLLKYHFLPNEFFTLEFCRYVVENDLDITPYIHIRNAELSDECWIYLINHDYRRYLRRLPLRYLDTENFIKKVPILQREEFWLYMFEISELQYKGMNGLRDYNGDAYFHVYWFVNLFLPEQFRTSRFFEKCLRGLNNTVLADFYYTELMKWTKNWNIKIKFDPCYIEG